MVDILFKHIQDKVSLTAAEKERIQTFFIQKRLRKHQYLLQEGEVCKHLAFVAMGLLRTYNIDDKGDSHMSVFGWEGWWLSDFNSFLSGEPAVFNIDAIEDSTLLLISRADYDEITIEVPIMDRYFRILFQNSLVTKERRLMSSINTYCRRKYLQLLALDPKIVERIPQHLIASYLGIAPETLSRIKKNLVARR
jgi:CRP-like cAMP-binding protein